MKILVFDNYDSFTYNLVQMIEQIVGKTVVVAKNNEISLQEIENFDKIILSPGPGIPNEAGILLEVIEHFAGKKSIFGVCLGLQAIAEVFGGNLINLKKIYHGVATEVEIVNDKAKIFKKLPTKIVAGRYHSWAVNVQNFPSDLEITAIDEDGMVMALQHKNYDLHAVQFHPESILTPMGKEILRNFLLN